MNTSPKEAEISRCSLAYQKLSGLKLDHRGVFDHRSRSWFEWLQAGYTVHDLETVILHLKRGIRDGKRNPGCLRFSNLIERPDLFGEELELAKAEIRNRKPEPSPKAQVQQQWSPTVAEPVRDNARHVSEFLKGIEAMRAAVNQTKP